MKPITKFTPTGYTTIELSDNLLEIITDMAIPQGEDGESEEYLDQMNAHFMSVFNYTNNLDIDWRDEHTCWLWLDGYGNA